MFFLFSYFLASYCLAFLLIVAGCLLSKLGFNSFALVFVLMESFLYLICYTPITFSFMENVKHFRKGLFRKMFLNKSSLFQILCSLLLCSFLAAPPPLPLEPYVKYYFSISISSMLSVKFFFLGFLKHF